jgi:hypothetical protein
MKKDAWRSRLYDELLEAARHGHWLNLGEVFPRYEAAIPLHMAMRFCAAYDREAKSASDARWKTFCFSVARFHIEDEPDRRHTRPRLVPASRVRLKPLDHKICPVCSGPLYSKFWSPPARAKGVCLDCGYTDLRRRPIPTGRTWEQLRALIHERKMQGKGFDMRVADLDLLDTYIELQELEDEKAEVISIHAARR